MDYVRINVTRDLFSLDLVFMWYSYNVMKYMYIMIPIRYACENSVFSVFLQIVHSSYWPIVNMQIKATTVHGSEKK